MKSSLKKAIRLFSFKEQVLLYAGLLLSKIGIQIIPGFNALLVSCNKYISLIERGVHFNIAGNGLLKTSYTINGKELTVFLRIGSSDLQVFESVIVLEEYKAVLPKITDTNNYKEKVIIDAGGNIGLTTVYLSCFLPQAKFYIIEPDANNFSMLLMNLKQNNLTLAKAFKKAFWINNENLVINNAFRDGKEWSLSVEESTMASAVDQSMVEGITLYDLCSKEDIKTVDLLKIDIEGAERVLFKDDDFLQATDKYIASIAVEIHDEFDIRPYINKKMETLGFSREEEGDISLYSKSMRSQVMPAEGSPF